MIREHLQPSISGLLPVFIISALCSLVIYFTDRLTSDQIALNRQMATIKIMEEVMPLSYDNKLYADRMQINDISTIAYRARQQGENIGLVFMPVTAHGYNGDISLAIGVSYAGDITGVRVMRHRETVGLGDRIHQDNSDWIHGFDNRSLHSTTDRGWALSKEGGQFDQISGATISPRGVINAVKSTLDYYALNREKLYGQMEE